MYKTLTLVTILATTVYAQSPSDSAPSMMMQSTKATPCPEIVAICRNAGFAKADDLMKVCVDPILKGDKTAPGTTKALPKVAQELIDKCKAARPATKN